MLHSPFTGLGQIQGEVHRLGSKVNLKAEQYEINSINSRRDCLERSFRELRSEIDGVLAQLQELEFKGRET